MNKKKRHKLTRKLAKGLKSSSKEKELKWQESYEKMPNSLVITEMQVENKIHLIYPISKNEMLLQVLICEDGNKSYWRKN